MNTSVFQIAIVAVFALLSILASVEVGLMVIGEGPLGFAEWAQIVSTVAASVLVLLGMLRLRRSRLSAYRMFLRAVLVSLLVTQVFAFYEEQWAGLVGLGLGLLVWVAVRYLIREEESIAEVQEASEHRTRGPVAVQVSLRDCLRSEPAVLTDSSRRLVRSFTRIPYAARGAAACPETDGTALHGMDAKERR